MIGMIADSPMTNEEKEGVLNLTSVVDRHNFWRCVGRNDSKAHYMQSYLTRTGQNGNICSANDLIDRTQDPDNHNVITLSYFRTAGLCSQINHDLNTLTVYGAVQGLRLGIMKNDNKMNYMYGCKGKPHLVDFFGNAPRHYQGNDHEKIKVMDVLQYNLKFEDQAYHAPLMESIQNVEFHCADGNGSDGNNGGNCFTLGDLHTAAMRRLFDFKPDVRAALDEYYNATCLPKNGKYIAVHIRRGDKMLREYTKDQVEAVDNIDWWCESISHLSGKFLLQNKKNKKNLRLPLRLPLRLSRLHIYIFSFSAAIYVP